MSMNACVCQYTLYMTNQIHTGNSQRRVIINACVQVCANAPLCMNGQVHIGNSQKTVTRVVHEPVRAHISHPLYNADPMTAATGNWQISRFKGHF